MSAQKVRLWRIWCAARKPVDALTLLRFTPKAAAEPVSKVIASAANGVENKQFTEGDLVIKEITVDGGTDAELAALCGARTLSPAACAKSCHINVVLEEQAAKECLSFCHKKHQAPIIGAKRYGTKSYIRMGSALASSATGRAAGLPPRRNTPSCCWRTWSLRRYLFNKMEKAGISDITIRALPAEPAAC